MKAILLPVITLTLWALLGSSGFGGEARSAKVGEARPAKDSLGDEGASKPIDRVDFENDLIPVFTKAGCNTGACHGAAVGRGGFKLSLYGGDPRADYESIVFELEGRRVDLARPEESLIVLKPTRQIAHRGGRRLRSDEEGAQLLLSWIKQGVGHETRRRLKRIDVAPEQHVAEHLGSSAQLRATAHFSDGTTRDVTRWTVFTAEDPSAVEIDSKAAVSKVLRRGRHIVIARYLDRVVPIELIVPLTDSKVDLAAEPRRNFIDEEILESLTTLGLPTSPVADDATFVRRVTLDLTGRLPAASTVRAFLGDPSPRKRGALVDELLGSEEFSEYWTLQLAKLLRIRSQREDKQGALKYHQWLQQQIKGDVGYDQLARSVIMASGDSHENGPANFYRTVDGPREQAEFMSELFMGSRLRCANCHNHPLDRWTQDDYHGLAAIFARIDGGRIVKTNPDGEVIHPRTLEKATQRIPGEQFLSEDVADGRKELASWLTKPGNPYFARAIVNRLWKRMMGRGLVEPADDFRATNPATHPVLLDKLASDFAENGYKLRHTLRLIAGSATYSRSANATPQNKADDRFCSHAARKPLEPEVLADAISDVLGVADKYGEEPAGTRAVSLFDPRTKSGTLDILGRCDRKASCESSAGPTGGLAQKLHLFNGALLNGRIGAPDSRLDRLISAGRSPMEIVGEFYLVALSRNPTDEEQRLWTERLEAMTSADKQRDFLEDFVWGLLTCNEFVRNH